MDFGESVTLSQATKSLVSPHGIQLCEAHHAGDKDVSVAVTALMVVALYQRGSSVHRRQLVQIPL
jgi:hypothetical protein